METPTGVLIVAFSPSDGTRNITEGVQALYDLVIQSMDWGSGFLSSEDVQPVVELAKFCGFQNYEEVESYMESALRKEKQHKCHHPEWREEAPPQAYLGTSGCKYIYRVCVECGLAVITEAASTEPPIPPGATKL